MKPDLEKKPNEKFKCDLCKDTGWIFTKQGMKKCKCRFESITDNLFERMKIPKRYRNKTLQNFKPDKEYGQQMTLNIIKGYIYQQKFKSGRGLILLGPPGVGKTHLAVGILNEMFIKFKIVGLFRDTRTMLFDLKSTFDGSASGRELLEEVITAPILVLDDLGSERLSDWAKDILHYIIITRYNEMKPVIITTNMNLKSNNEFETSLEDRMGKAIASRLFEMCELVPVLGIDRRNIKKNGLDKL